MIVDKITACQEAGVKTQPLSGQRSPYNIGEAACQANRAITLHSIFRVV